VVSQRSPTFGTSDALIPLKRNGILLVRTWERRAFHFGAKKGYAIHIL
jgi:hypothetical protein